MCWEGLSLGDVLVLVGDAVAEAPTCGPSKGIICLTPRARAWALAQGCSRLLGEARVLSAGSHRGAVPQMAPEKA